MVLFVIHRAHRITQMTLALQEFSVNVTDMLLIWTLFFITS